MIKLKKLTGRGNERFLDLCRKNDSSGSNFDIEKFTTEEISENIIIDPSKIFVNKLELGEYLYEKLKDISVENSVWHFLVIVYHKQLLKDGKIGEIDRFYIDPQKSYYPFTHLLKPVFDLYSFYYDKKDLIDFLLLNPINETGQLFLETVKRQDMMKNQSFIQVSRKLFYDDKNKKIKRGIQNDLRRLIALFKQYERAYDLYSMPAEKILKNLITRHQEFEIYT